MVATKSDTVIETLGRIEKDLGLSVVELGSALGVSADTIECWRCGDSTPDGEARQRLDQLLALREHLRETLAPDSIRDWLRWTPVYLGGITPAEAIARGQADRVETLLTIIDYGIFT